MVLHGEIVVERDTGELEGLSEGDTDSFPTVEEGGGGVYLVGHGSAVEYVTEVVSVGTHDFEVVVVEVPPL